VNIPVDRLIGDRRDLRLWTALTGAATLSSLAVLPYVLSMRAEALKESNKKRRAQGKRPVTLPLLAAASVPQSAAMFALTTALGLRAARRIGLGAPHLAAVLNGEPSSFTGKRAGEAAAAGVGTGLVLAGLDAVVFRDVQKRLERGGIRQPGVRDGLLASTYGAVAEEVLLRLGVLSGCALGLGRLRGAAGAPPDSATMWTAIAGSSVLFGLGHLPALRSLVRPDAALIVRTLVLNGIAGTVFGWLYWRRDLESAMIAHGATDLVLHVGGPLWSRGTR
jgi:membrane protease YdiL (CAAX protease family)